MVKGLYNAAQTMHNRMTNIDIVANNLANISTSGYKREIPFSEFLDQYNNEKLTQLTDFSEGALINTGNQLDLSIQGNGFFMLETKRGVELTKSGSFQISDDGYLIDKDGNKVITENGQLNFSEILFEKDNTIQIRKNGEIAIGEKEIGKLKIAGIEDQLGMRRTENQNFFFPEGGYHNAQEDSYTIKQGYLEESNTNPITEMQNMIKLNKDYETASKIIKSLDQIMAKAQEIGRV